MPISYRRSAALSGPRAAGLKALRDDRMKDALIETQFLVFSAPEGSLRFILVRTAGLSRQWHAGKNPFLGGPSAPHGQNHTADSDY